MRLFTDTATPKMIPETRGQNSWVNYGPHGEANRANQKETVYADQKIGLMPEWTWQEGVDDDVDYDELEANIAPDFRSVLDEADRISARFPTQKQSTEDPLSQTLGVGLEACVRVQHGCRTILSELVQEQHHEERRQDR